MHDEPLAAAGLSRAGAARVARRIAGAQAQLAGSEVERIVHRVIRETTEALYRVRLQVRAEPDAPALAHVCVVKVMRADAPDLEPHRARFGPSEEPAHPNYWRREYDAYGTSLLEGLPPPLRAPVCYERTLEERRATLWLEAATGAAPDDWSDERYHAIACALGAWQAAFAARRASADEPLWFARDALRLWAPPLGGSAHAAAQRDGVFASPRARAAFGSATSDLVGELWRDRDASLALLEGLGATIAHGDFWTRNLIASTDPSDSVVAIDWSELGLAPPAHDLVNLVLDSVWMLDVRAARLNAIEGAALAGYEEGWRAGGGSPEISLETAYRLSARLRFGALAGTLAAQAADARKRDAIAARYGRSYEDVFEARSAVVRAALESVGGTV